MAPSNSPKKLRFETEALHADDTDLEAAVAAPISVSTTFKYPAGLKPEDAHDVWNPRDPKFHIYSRATTPTSIRVEKVLSSLLDGHALTYSSGLAAAYAVLIHYDPKRVAIRQGYHGVHAILDIIKRTKKTEFDVIDLDDEYRPGDLCWLETPLNPTGESRDLQYYADKIHAVGGKLVIDSTFGPPPLQYPFKHGADTIFHSATKYLGGHSDLLAGVVVVKTHEESLKLVEDRVHLGSTIGSLEAWLLLRSLRSFAVRVPRQSETGTKLAKWLNEVSKVPAGKTWDGAPGGVVASVTHSSLQGVDPKTGFDPAKQMTGGFPATFSFMCHDAQQAGVVPFATKLFKHATSLGGVESLIEQRRFSSPTEDEKLIRVSTGLESFEDLRDDLRQALWEAAGSPKAKL